MRILCINTKPDLSYFTKRGLKLELEYQTLKKVWPINFITTVPGGAMYTPYPVEDINNQQYDFVIVGWNPKDYGSEMKYSGGYTHKTPTAKGAYWMTVRQDGNPTYVIHEMHHALVKKLMAMTGNYIADHMDLDAKGRAFYLNDQPENPESNYAQTWNEIKPYLDVLNGNKVTYKYFTAKEIEGLKPELCAMLDKARELAGVPFFLNSTLRSPEKNAEVGGVENSSHLKGEAVDIRVRNSSERFKILQALIEVGFKRIGVGETFIHADIDKSKPNEVMWTYK